MSPRHRDRRNGAGRVHHARGRLPDGAAGKPVIAVEYVSGASQVASVESHAAADGIGYYIANPNFQLDGVDTRGFTTSSSGSTSTQVALSSITASPANADLGVGQTETFTVTFSAPVQVSGATPGLLLNDGGKATYVSGSGTNALVFKYTVGAGQNTTKLALSSHPFVNGASITDTSGNAANLSAWANGQSLSGTILVDTSRTRTTIANGKGGTYTASGNDVVVLTKGSAKLVFEGSNNVAFIGGSTRAATAINR
jgi:large repetitive protein